jgi:hypothetical protein
MKNKIIKSDCFSLLITIFFLTGMSLGVYSQTDGGKVKQKVDHEQELIQLKMQEPQVIVPNTSASGRAVGDDCSTPIVVNIPAGLPFSDLGNTTCGRGNNYSNSDLGSYDGGEDIIYQLVVSTATEVIITMNPKSSMWSGLALFTSCPVSTGSSIQVITGSSTTPRTIQQTLAPGTYYVMADTWPTPNCIVSFDLTITQVLPPEPYVVPFCEDFSGVAAGVLPGGWIRDRNNWGVTQSMYAGGAVPEMMFDWEPSFTGNSVLKSLVIDATAISPVSNNLVLSFNHFVDYWATPFSVSVLVSTDGATWNNLQEWNPTGNVGPELVTIELGNTYCGQEFYVGFGFSGNSFNIDYWYIDNVCVSSVEKVPLSDWALYAGVFLIFVLAVWRFRKVF